MGQHLRLLKLDSPLGKDILLPQRLVASERLSHGYEVSIDVLATETGIALESLIAQPVTLWIRQHARDYLPLHGYVHTAKRLGSDGEIDFCQLAFSPWLHFLRFRKDARLWQDKTTEDILADVFDCHPQARGHYRFELERPSLFRSYCTQYETDWHFVQRLMEEEGWFAHHEQREDGSGHVLVITDNNYSLLGAALRAVMLLLIKEASKLLELIQFLQKFIKGDVMKFLREVKFARYEKSLLDAIRKLIGQLVSMVTALRVHLESFRYFDSVKNVIARLNDWERKFYAVQQDSLNNIPKALAELDTRLQRNGTVGDIIYSVVPNK